MNRILSKKRVARRYPIDPVITSEMIPYSCRGVHSSSVVAHGDRYVMIRAARGTTRRLPKAGPTSRGAPVRLPGAPCGASVRAARAPRTGPQDSGPQGDVTSA
jgi:hypothetical protein